MKNRETLLLSGLVAVILFLSLPLHAAEKHFFVLPKGKAGRDTNFFSLDKEDGRSASTRSKEGMSAMMAMAAQDRAREENRVLEAADRALEESEKQALAFKAKIAQEQAAREAAWKEKTAVERAMEQAENKKRIAKNFPSTPMPQTQSKPTEPEQQKEDRPPPQQKEPRLDDGSVPGTTISPSGGSGRNTNDPIRLPR
jgi:hypothetical protein